MNVQLVANSLRGIGKAQRCRADLPDQRCAMPLRSDLGRLAQIGLGVLRLRSTQIKGWQTERRLRGRWLTFLTWRCG